MTLVSSTSLFRKDDEDVADFLLSMQIKSFEPISRSWSTRISTELLTDTLRWETIRRRWKGSDSGRLVSDSFSRISRSRRTFELSTDLHPFSFCRLLEGLSSRKALSHQVSELLQLKWGRRRVLILFVLPQCSLRRRPESIPSGEFSTNFSTTFTRSSQFPFIVSDRRWRSTSRPIPSSLERPKLARQPRPGPAEQHAGSDPDPYPGSILALVRDVV